MKKSYEEFRSFLEREGALEAFDANVANDSEGSAELEKLLNEGSIEGKNKDIVNILWFNAFVWANTPQGENYWRELEHKRAKELGIEVPDWREVVQEVLSWSKK